MAYQRIVVSNKRTDNFNENDYTLGIKLPMNSVSGEQGAFNQSKTTEEQSVSNLISLLLTRPGERFMQPNFGVGLDLYIFEQNTNSNNNSLETAIRKQINHWLPYIRVNRITVIPNEAYKNIIIDFSPREYSANMTISTFVDGEGSFNVEVA